MQRASESPGTHRKGENMLNRSDVSDALPQRGGEIGQSLLLGHRACTAFGERQIIPQLCGLKLLLLSERSATSEVTKGHSCDVRPLLLKKPPVCVLGLGAEEPRHGCSRREHRRGLSLCLQRSVRLRNPGTVAQALSSSRSFRFPL